MFEAAVRSGGADGFLIPAEETKLEFRQSVKRRGVDNSLPFLCLLPARGRQVQV